MKERKLKHLFDAARDEKTPAAPANFDARVMSAIRREERLTPPTVWEQLGQLFPRLATAAIAAILVCCLADIFHAAYQSSNAKTDLEELSDQWLFAANGGANE